jgi:predicted O-linked N-acetylglucosamine transferase (SPINDLY family)
MPSTAAIQHEAPHRASSLAGSVAPAWSGGPQGTLAALARQVQQAPDDGPAWKLLGALRLVLESPAAALPALQRAAELLPDDAEAHSNLASALFAVGDPAAAEAAARRALALAPGFAAAWDNLGIALAAQSRLDAAEAACRQALALDATRARSWHHLALLLRDAQRNDEARAAIRTAIDHAPHEAEYANLLGALLAADGEHAEAEAWCRKAVELAPDLPGPRSTLLLLLQHHGALSPKKLFEAHREFGRRLERAVGRVATPRRPLDPERPLRLGFVSGDFRRHAAAHFIEPVWRELDRTRFSLHAYAVSPAADEVTERLRGLVDTWTSAAGLDDEALAAAIRGDGIDILFDLSGHTAHHRLGVFARRPAPLQASWIGYPGTTGLRAMDYYFVDRGFAPPGKLDAQFTERLVHLPTVSVFRPDPCSPQVGPLPALAAGHFTFGSFNRAAKITDATLHAWAAVLDAVPDARLLVGAIDPPLAGRLRERLAAQGIDPARTKLRPRTGLADYLAAHHGIDLLLDAFPYTGGTTTAHGLWMGVPTLTFEGETLASRSSAAILRHAGLDAFIARDAAGLAALAARWAREPQALATLRNGLRAQLAGAPQRDARRVVEGLEDALRWMWRRHCIGKPPVAFRVAPRGGDPTGVPA